MGAALVDFCDTVTKVTADALFSLRTVARGVLVQKSQRGVTAKAVSRRSGSVLLVGFRSEPVNCLESRVRKRASHPRLAPFIVHARVTSAASRGCSKSHRATVYALRLGAFICNARGCEEYKPQQWQNLFPDEIFTVRYEELVMDQETVSEQLIDYVGLQWDEKCLDFHNNERDVRTVSNMQVRQPMYKNSMNRWKHYEKHLQPLIEVLQQAS